MEGRRNENNNKYTKKQQYKIIIQTMQQYSDIKSITNMCNAHSGT
jgi:hypothetical protein